MQKITIADLEGSFHVGVPESERSTPQRLLVTVEMELDWSKAAEQDDLASTIDYYAVTRDILNLSQGRSWKLIEKLASDIADLVLTRYRPEAVEVEVKKFIIPETRFVSVRLHRSRRA